MAKMRCIECGCKLNKKHTPLSCALLVAAHKLAGQAFESGTLQGSYDSVSPVHDNPIEPSPMPNKSAIEAGPDLTIGHIGGGSPLAPRPSVPGPPMNPSALQEGPTMLVRVRVPKWKVRVRVPKWKISHG